ncbi:hypothetical protein HRG84_05910 [Flavisolibacter sp. BT320]|nr:hypothetical protein [Flavisolibacter longurius]
MGVYADRAVCFSCRSFPIEGPGEIIATDNSDPASLVSFASPGREMYSGLVLAIVRTKKGKQGNIRIKAAALGLKDASLEISRRLFLK